MKYRTPVVAAVMMIALHSGGQRCSGSEGAQQEPPPQPAPQTLCPVMDGKRVNTRLYVDYQGFRIYVCCNPCVKAARKNPEKYLRKLREQGVSVAVAPAGPGAK